MKFQINQRGFKNLEIVKFHENPSSGSRIVPDGHTVRET
jgi:hypothetical protein